METEEEQVEAEVEINTPEDQTNAPAEDEYVIEEEWMDYFDRLEEMELSKDQGRKEEVKVDQVKDVKEPKKDKPIPMPKVTKTKKQLNKSVKKEASKKKKVEPNVPVKINNRNVELEKTLNEISELVDKITNSKNGHETNVKAQLKEIKDDIKKPKKEEADKVQEPGQEEEISLESVVEETEEILKSAEEIILENEALRKENGDLRQELKEQEDDDDDDDDDDNDDDEVKAPEHQSENMYKTENYPTYDGDLDVLTDSFEEGSKDEWDQYFDDLEHKKPPGPKVEPKTPKKENNKHEPESPVYKDEDYPHYNVDLDVLMDSFEEAGPQDEYTRYFDALEEEENRRLNEKVKKKKGRRSGGGSSFFAEAMPMKDNRTRIRQFLEREKQRRELMKQKIDRESIKNLIKEKSNEKKEKEDSPKETNENSNVKKNDQVEEISKEETKGENNQQTVDDQNKADYSSVLQETLLKLVKDVEKLLYQNGYSNGEANIDASPDTKSRESKGKDTKRYKSKKLEGEMGKGKPTKLKGDTVDMFSQNIDFTDPESIVNTIKHTTRVANKMMQELADSLTEQLMNVKAARGAEDDDEEGDEPWEVIEERDEKLRQLCKKGRLSSADCNQVSSHFASISNKRTLHYGFI